MDQKSVAHSRAKIRYTQLSRVSCAHPAYGNVTSKARRELVRRIPKRANAFERMKDGRDGTESGKQGARS